MNEHKEPTEGRDAGASKAQAGHRGMRLIVMTEHKPLATLRDRPQFLLINCNDKVT